MQLSERTQATINHLIYWYINTSTPTVASHIVNFSRISHLLKAKKKETNFSKFIWSAVGSENALNPIRSTHICKQHCPRPIYYPTCSFYPILQQPMWQQAMCHTHTPPCSVPPLPYHHPSSIDQWTYSWPQNFGTGHKLHKTKPNQTGVEAEEAAMKCIANALKFHKLCGPTPPLPPPPRQICASHTLILRFPQMTAMPRPMLAYTYIYLEDECHFGSSRKRNYRKSEFKAKWPMALAA